MRFLVTSICLAFALLVTHIEVSAATFSVNSPFITMDGEITEGDAEKLAAIFIQVKPLLPNYFPYPSALYLNSPGGNVSEAIRIAELVKTLGISVVVVTDGKGKCVSSCFLIYVAAIDRSASGIDTLRNEGVKGNLGPLGIHRPYLREPTGGPVDARRQEQVMAEMRDYLVKSSVGQSLIDKMMSHASNDIYWLNAEEVRDLGSYSPGVEEQLIYKCGYNSKRESNLSASEFIESHRSGVLACVSDYMVKTYGTIIQDTVERMRKGWRPWK